MQVLRRLKNITDSNEKIWNMCVYVCIHIKYNKKKIERGNESDLTLTW